MRFPNTPPMWRTFDLFKRLNFSGDYDPNIGRPGEGQGKIPSDLDGLGYDDEGTVCVQPGNLAGNTDDVIPYILETGEDWEYFNGIKHRKKDLIKIEDPDPLNDPFHVSLAQNGTVPNDYVKQGVQYWVDAKLGYFKQLLIDDFQSARKLLMCYDHNSTRQFMYEIHPKLMLPFRTYMQTTYPDRPLEFERKYPTEVRQIPIISFPH